MRIAIILTAILLTNCSKKIDSKPIQAVKVQKNKTIDILENGKKIATITYNQENVPDKEIGYDITTRKEEYELVYVYNNKNLVDINVKKGVDLEYLRYSLDNISQNKFLHKKGIKLEHPEIVSSEINDLATVLTVGKNYDDFKKDSIVNGNEKTIIYKNFNKKIRFYPSYITLFVPEDEIIKDYNLVIKDSLPIKETFLLENNQSLRREYFYDKNRIKKITYISSDPTNKLQREFIYKN